MAFIFVGSALILSSALLAAYFIGKLNAENKGLKERIQRLEEAQAKHLPYPTADGIEDATAAILRLKFEADFRRELVDNALAHLQQARAGSK